MKNALAKILKIIEKQIDDLSEKSVKARLDQQEVDTLGSLARTFILVTTQQLKGIKSPRYRKGQYMTDEQLVERASDETNPKED